MADVLFTKVDYTLKKLLEDIDLGEIGLPDIQRPFVWSRAKVRDLLNSPCNLRGTNTLVVKGLVKVGRNLGTFPDSCQYPCILCQQES